eukprot:gene42897-53224_t
MPRVLLCALWAYIGLSSTLPSDVVTQNEGTDFLTDIAASQFFSLIAACFLYFFILLIIEGGSALAAISESENIVSNQPGSEKMIRTMFFDKLKVIPCNGVKSNSSSPRTISVRIKGSVDPDVLAEKQKVGSIVASGSMSAQNNAVFISNLNKIYYGKGSTPA